MNPPHPQDARSIWLAAAAVIGVLLLWALRSVVMLVAFGVLLAYVLDPVVSAVERIRFPRRYCLPRQAAAATVILAIVIGGAWVASWGGPRLIAEIAEFVQGIPANAQRFLVEADRWATERGMGSYVDPAVQSVHTQLTAWLEGLGGTVLSWTGKLLGTLGRIIGFAVLPLLAYYLLAEREDVKNSFLTFIPENAHERFHETLHAIDRALKSYVRGQVVVCFIMGTTVGLALAVLGYPAVLLLGIIVGIAEVLPYIGFLLAAVAIALTGYGMGILQAVLGVAVYAVLNVVIGLLVTPRVMGRHLKMHPFVVTVSVLAGAELMGPAGAMLALPTAAVLQSLAEQFAPRRVVTTRIATAEDLAAGQS